MAKTSLEIVNPPSYIYVGETLGLNVLTDAKTYTVTLDPVHLIELNETRDKMTGIAAGAVKITVTARRDLYEANTASIDLRVLEKESRTTSIMLHNRETNRVSKIMTQPSTNKDLVVNLPATDLGGTLLTKESILTKFTTIQTPVILHPAMGAIDCEGQITASDYATNMGYAGAHEGTVWEYATDKEFTNILDTRTIIRGDKTKGPIIHSGITIWVRCKYVSYDVESHWSEPIQFTCKVMGRDSKRTLVSGDHMCGYFGNVPHEECINDRDYRGNFPTLIANNLKTFKVGQSVSKEGVLYYATKAMNANSVVDPKTSVDEGLGYWAVDNREDLPTPRWVNEVTGIGFSFDDANGDGYSTGSTYVGNITNNLDGWLKYSYNGKVCYIPKRPICTQVCWNDIGKRDIMYGDRTFRGGANQMYRIRLMKEDEYTSIIPKLMDGALANFTPYELGLVYESDIRINNNNWTYVNNKIAYVDYGAEYGKRDMIYRGKIEVVEVQPITFNITASGEKVECEVVQVILNYNNVKTFFNSKLNIWYRDLDADFTAKPEEIFMYLDTLDTVTATKSSDNRGYTITKFFTSNKSKYEGTDTSVYLASEQYSYKQKEPEKIDGEFTNFGRTDMAVVIKFKDDRVVSDAGTFSRFRVKLRISDIEYSDQTTSGGVSVNTTNDMLTFNKLGVKQDAKIRMLESYRQGALTWLEDFQEGAFRKVGDHTGKVIYQSDPKSRVATVETIPGISKWYMCYRPVIELVTESDEPWKNWPLGPIADDEEFRYDRWTDTGYFGRIRNKNFINGEDLSKMLGFPTFTEYESEKNEWLKFYWHGIMIYTGRYPHTSKYITYTEINRINADVSFDTGARNNVKPTIMSIPYMCGLPTIMSHYPTDVDNPNAYMSSGGPGLGQYGFSLELFYRILTIDGKDYVNDIIDAWYINYWCSPFGLQVGDNWDNLPHTDIFRGDVMAVERDGSLHVTHNAESNGNIKVTISYSDDQGALRFTLKSMADCKVFLNRETNTNGLLQV